MKKIKHWQDPLNLVLGLCLAASPWVMGYEGHGAAMWNAVVAGLALAAVAAGAVFVPRAWEEWSEAALGLWMVISPWVLGFTAMQTAVLCTTLTGLVVLALALWVLFTDKDYMHWSTAH